ncbi:DNA-binding transcriptional regulator, XRE-family HTH domain [Aneurinibacillus thermoaerophilus]|uniref:DNA-binding transcriptional regulator, XRE-family HTH domain n=1 Tax=Aneurinibacillus thermoaerophilus TaxID=143495 RepID=A0A1G8FKP3_ANETH|nr:helix-turn-helix transcriptional regulator [Aneurinibacillus thermoaerophilus]SDH82596.1 DNA-binding transcriptional regulator, XRE-family HTH domain [Aneurinibacillus thermoaerophilus]
MNNNKNEKLISLRVVKGLSQDEAANLIGISRSMLAMMELGKRLGRYPTLKKVADFYGSTVEEIFYAQNAHVKRHKTKSA